MKRYVWLRKQIRARKYSLGAEVGVRRGITTFYLLRSCRGLVMCCVDNWQGDWAKYRRRFFSGAKKFGRRITVLEGDSAEMADHVADCSLDFVFIDADHEYESVRKDLIAWIPKLKPNGLLCGHDIHFPGVKQACDELLLGYYESAGLEIDWIWWMNV